MGVIGTIIGLWDTVNRISEQPLRVDELAQDHISQNISSVPIHSIGDTLAPLNLMDIKNKSLPLINQSEAILPNLKGSQSSIKEIDEEEENDDDEVTTGSPSKQDDDPDALIPLNSETSKESNQSNR